MGKKKSEEEKLVHLLRETRKLRLRGIALTESHTKLTQLKDRKLPGIATQAINFTVGMSEKKDAAIVFATFKLDARYEEEGDAPLTFIAVFRITYAIAEPFSSAETAGDATQRVALLNIWPYWREFVQSSSTRMGLPPFPIPLVNPAQLKLDKGEMSKKSLKHQKKGDK